MSEEYEDLLPEMEPYIKAAVYTTVGSCLNVLFFSLGYTPEDVLQDGRIKAWEVLKRYKPKGAEPSTVVFRAVHNRCLDLLAKSKKNGRNCLWLRVNLQTVNDEDFPEGSRETDCRLVAAQDCQPDFVAELCVLETVLTNLPSTLQKIVDYESGETTTPLNMTKRHRNRLKATVRKHIREHEHD